MDEKTEKCLIEYVTNQKADKDCKEKIKEFCEKQPRVVKTLFRGHNNTKTIHPNHYWYSATSSKKVAKDEFSNKNENCCVFIIHLVDVPVIDVNLFVGDKIGDYREEKEFIFLGGGTFYEDAELTKNGFINKKNGEYECWYKLDEKPPEFDVETIASKIDKDEYEFIETPKDLELFFNEPLTETQQQSVFQIIELLKSKQKSIKGGKMKIQKKYRNTKSSRKKSSRKTRKQHK